TARIRNASTAPASTRARRTRRRNISPGPAAADPGVGIARWRPRAPPRLSVHGDVGGADHVAPALRLLLEQRGHLLGAAAAGLEIELLVAGHDRGLLQDLVHRGVQLGDDGRR